MGLVTSPEMARWSPGAGAGAAITAEACQESGDYQEGQYIQKRNYPLAHC